MLSTSRGALQVRNIKFDVICLCNTMNLFCIARLPTIVMYSCRGRVSHILSMGLVDQNITVSRLSSIHV